MYKNYDKDQRFILRCTNAGVFYAKIESITDTVAGRVADIRDVRRIHYWDGAASLSQLANEGCKSNSRVTVTVPAMEVLDVIEIIPCADKAVSVIDAIPVWRIDKR